DWVADVPNQHDLVIGPARIATPFWRDFFKRCIMRSPETSIWMVHVLSGPAINFTTSGLVGLVTSIMLQPWCHRWPMYRYHRPPTWRIDILKPGRPCKSL